MSDKKIDKPFTIPPDIAERLEKLEQKYAVMGQDLRSYLDGLLYADYLNYWDYIRLDVLLNLQAPLTPFKDESIFIIYHQITELYFKLSLQAIERIAEAENLSVNEFIKQTKRLNSYFSALISSFDIMIDGMDKEQFLKFRMSLLPASGFQSGQYRMIELSSTDIINLVSLDYREKFADAHLSVEEKYYYLYWKRGANELKTGKKTLTLKKFEEKYEKTFKQLAENYKERNLWQCYCSLPELDRENPDLIRELRQFDLNANVLWPLMHYKSAVRYLHREEKDIAATGGTNWQKYLPPRNQGIMFFPKLWTEQERQNWGKFTDHK